ncbi:MAG: NTP transferase domain-containing protein [Deltaproteobacteria bacterium]|nr:NTP transferase domain-containing protein [Deltaproteobacteria bacterium]
MITQAVILAAGKGQRLNGHEVPKPLAMVGGRTLLRRALDSLGLAGVRDVGIVVGYRGVEIKAAFAGGHPEVRITWIENPDYDKPNGVSLLAARWFLKGRAFLLMADHVFCPDVLLPLANLDARGDATALVVDSDIARCYDLDDATKVLRSGDLVVDIGKQIPAFDGIDTGIFLISPRLVSELARLEAPSLSDGVRCLAHRGLVRAHDIDGRLWQDVDTPETRTHTEWLLRAYGQELRGRPPTDCDAAVCFRVASLKVANARACRRRAVGSAEASALIRPGEGRAVGGRGLAPHLQAASHDHGAAQGRTHEERDGRDLQEAEERAHEHCQRLGLAPRRSGGEAPDPPEGGRGDADALGSGQELVPARGAGRDQVEVRDGDGDDGADGRADSHPGPQGRVTAVRQVGRDRHDGGEGGDVVAGGVEPAAEERALVPEARQLAVDSPEDGGALEQERAEQRQEVAATRGDGDAAHQAGEEDRDADVVGVDRHVDEQAGDPRRERPVQAS